jgi:hypothetical protein
MYRQWHRGAVSGFGVPELAKLTAGISLIDVNYPTDENKIRSLFVAMAKRLGAAPAEEDVPPIPQRGRISGADIEGHGRAWRHSLL